MAPRTCATYLRAEGYLLKVFLQGYFFGVRTDEVNFRLTNLKIQTNKETSFSSKFNANSARKRSHSVTYTNTE